MKRFSLIGTCLLLGLLVAAIETAERIMAGEPLPGASVVAYRGPARPKKPAQPKISDVNLTGVIDSVSANGLTIKASKTSKSKDQKQWLVGASETTDFTIRGTATPDYLRNGQMVEFSGQVVTTEKSADKAKEDKPGDKAKEDKPGDKAKEDKPGDKAKEDKPGDEAKEDKPGDKADEDQAADEAKEEKPVVSRDKEDRVADKVKEITIYSRKPKSSTTKKADAKDHPAAPGVGRIDASKADDDVNANLAAPEPSTIDQGKPKAGKPGAKPDPAADGAKEKIAGRIAAHDEKGFTVTRGQQTIRVELADLATINVELTNPKLIPNTKDASKSRIEGKGPNGKTVSMTVADMVGAKIVAQGRGSESQQGNFCVAKSIVVTLATPLTGKKKSASPEAKKTLADK